MQRQNSTTLTCSQGKKGEKTLSCTTTDGVIDMIGLVIKPLLGIFLVALEVNSKSYDLPTKG